MDGYDPNILQVIVTHKNGTWRTLETSKFTRSKLSSDERAWHFTDGTNVLGYRCDKQGPLEAWIPN